MLFVLLKFLLLFPFLLYLYYIDCKNRKGQLRLYGITGFFGLPGTGKTIAMCRELQGLRKKYGKNIYIMTNFNYLDEDFKFNSWLDLTKQYDKPLIVAWDEIQNEFNSRDFKNFPIALLTQLTQVRKGNGIKLFYTSQRYGFVDKNFRQLSSIVCDCSTRLGRFTVVKAYDSADYEELCATYEVDKKRKIHPRYINSFVQSQKLRDSYDSFAMLNTARFKAQSGAYMNRAELAQIDKGV